MDVSAVRNELREYAREVAAGKGNRDEKLGAICAAIRERLPGYDWVGIYFADNEKRELILGPFAGEPTEHVSIPFGRGICGQTAESGEVTVVDDVGKESNYLSCSVEVRSEIVLPICRGGEFAAELDIDSHRPANFGDEDRLFLEEICRVMSSLL